MLARTGHTCIHTHKLSTCKHMRAHTHTALDAHLATAGIRCLVLHQLCERFYLRIHTAGALLVDHLRLVVPVRGRKPGEGKSVGRSFEDKNSRVQEAAMRCRAKRKLVKTMEFSRHARSTRRYELT